jgi:hypothetical protein
VIAYFRLGLGLGFVLLLAVPSPAAAIEEQQWSLTGGFGVVDQEAIGGTASVAASLERRLGTAFSLGLMGGYFGKEDCCGARRDTTYGVVFATARWPRDGVQPFLQVGAGRYEFERENQSGWLAGVGFDIPLRGRFGLSLSARYHSVERPENGPLPDFKEVQLAGRIAL